MKIEKLEIKNFRGFKGERTVEFKKDFNVFVGVNGSGKTSLLDLLVFFLSDCVNHTSGLPSKKTTSLDVHLDAIETVNKLEISVEIPNHHDGGYENRWQLAQDLYTNSCKTQSINPSIHFPIFRYFQAQRISTETEQRPVRQIKRYYSERFKAWEAAFDETSGFNDFFEWFVEEENKENREKVSLKNLDHTNPKLEAIRKALKIFLENFTAYKYENLRVEERPFNLKTNEKSSLVINKNGKPYNLKQFSDGERLLILMVADVAHRLAIANPELDDCLNGDGIVLIDEIDLHLHPAWQREVIPCLAKTFPGIQFFATTHSPQVLSSIPAENIIIIEDFEFVKYTPNTLGKDSNSILWDIFGVTERPNIAKQQFITSTKS